jgi:hypothetical protein
LSAGVVTERRTKVRPRKLGFLEGWRLPAALAVAVALGLAALLLLPGSGPTSGMRSTAAGIEGDLDQADAYLAAGIAPNAGARKLISPDDDSALTLYRRALVAEPGNARAREGIAKLRSYYRHYSRVACQSRQWSNCSAIAGMGLKVDPTDSALVEIKASAEKGQRAGER